RLRPPSPPLLPYTTLFRSLRNRKKASFNNCFELSGVEWISAQQSEIHRVWDKYRGWAMQRGALPDPQAFASSYVDQHFEANIRRSEEHTSELQSRENLVCR